MYFTAQVIISLTTSILIHKDCITKNTSINTKHQW